MWKGAPTLNSKEQTGKPANPLRPHTALRGAQPFPSLTVQGLLILSLCLAKPLLMVLQRFVRALRDG